MGTEATCLQGSAAVASSPIVNEIKEMITKAYDQCKPGRMNDSLTKASTTTAATNDNNNSNTTIARFSDGSSMAYFLDELSHAVRGGKLVEPIREWLEEVFQNDFEAWYVGDFEENGDDCDGGARKGGGGGKKGGGEMMLELDAKQIPTSSRDLALLNGTPHNTSPPGQLRYNIAGSDNDVYLPLLGLLSSSNRIERDILPVTLSPMFRLTSTLSDVRYGGRGLSEIDAMLECPLLMPTIESSGEEFEELSSMKQWVVTSSYFFAASWVRQLINSFIYAADDENETSATTSAAASSSAPTAGSFTCSSQGFNSGDVQKKIVARLRALVDLENELEFTSSKCFVFAPPGKQV